MAAYHVAIREVPPDWWQAACEAIQHPLACVSPNSRFIWVNGAFERLVGYSLAELRELTWMDITDQPDVGGDLASVQDVLTGKRVKYSLSKYYKHKLGKLVGVTITVCRFPLSVVDDVTCFIVETTPEMAQKDELEKVHAALRKEIDTLQTKFVEHLTEMNRRHGHNDDQVVTVNVGNNSNKVVIALAVAAVAISLVVGWIAYYAFGDGQQPPPSPPHTTHTTHTTEDSQ